MSKRLQALLLLAAMTSALALLIVVGASSAVDGLTRVQQDPQPLPADLVALAGDAGQELLDDADDIADLSALSEAFVAQSRVSWCGVASAVAGLGALGRPVEQEAFFSPEVAAVKSRLAVTLGGMTLAELGALLTAHGAGVDIHHAGADDDLSAFRAAVRANLARGGDVMLVNFHRAELAQEGGGHISPLAAYEEQSDRVLVLDTAAHRYPPFWVELPRLYAAMDTQDRAASARRGWVELR